MSTFGKVMAILAIVFIGIPCGIVGSLFLVPLVGLLAPTFVFAVIVIAIVAIVKVVKS